MILSPAEPDQGAEQQRGHADQDSDGNDNSFRLVVHCKVLSFLSVEHQLYDYLRRCEHIEDQCVVICAVIDAEIAKMDLD
jgi:hypothetical protein